MSKVSDAIAEVNQAADEAISRVQEDVASLKQQIADLEAQQPTGADLQALNDLKDKLAALDPTQPDTLPTT